MILVDNLWHNVLDEEEMEEIVEMIREWINTL